MRNGLLVVANSGLVPNGNAVDIKKVRAVAILGLNLLPIVLILILAFICALQIVLNLRDHPHHRIIKLWYLLS
jgi:hypothetical protein